MESSYSRWSLAAILIFPLTLLLAFWLYSTAETLPEQISAYLLAAAFFLVALGMLVEVLLADLLYWGMESAFEAIVASLLSPFGENISRFAADAKRVLILLFVAAWLVDVAGTVARAADQLVPCTSTYRELLVTPCDAAVLAACPFTEPLAGLVLQDADEFPARANRLLETVMQYLGLFTDCTYLLLLPLLLSGLPRQLWGSILFALTSLLGEGKVVTLLQTKAANDYVHNYKGQWIVAIRDEKLYHAPKKGRNWRRNPEFVTGSLDQVATVTPLFDSYDQAVTSANKLLRGCDEYLARRRRAYR